MHDAHLLSALNVSKHCRIETKLDGKWWKEENEKRVEITIIVASH